MDDPYPRAGWRWIRNAPADPAVREIGNFTGNVDRWHYYDYVASSIAVIDFGSADAGAIADALGDGMAKALALTSSQHALFAGSDGGAEHWLSSRFSSRPASAARAIQLGS